MESEDVESYDEESDDGDSHDEESVGEESGEEDREFGWVDDEDSEGSGGRVKDVDAMNLC